MMAAAEEALGKVDILINSAGIITGATLAVDGGWPAQ